jgi:ATP-dependent DNA helicase 2 subunit 2
MFQGPGSMERNRVGLKDLVDTTGGNMFGREDAEEQIERLRLKSVISVNTRFDIDISDSTKWPEEGIRLQVMMPLKTTKLALPSAKKYSAISEGLPETDRTGNVEAQYTFSFMGENEEAVEVDKDDLIKAYRFGKTLVPFSAEDAEAIKYRCNKGLYVIGFLKLSQVFVILCNC